MRKKHFKDILPLLPLRDIVAFPHMVVPLLVGRERSMNAVSSALSDKYIFLATQKEMQIDNPEPTDIHHIGTIAKITQVSKLPDGSLKIMAEGIARARIVRFLSNERFLKVSIEPLQGRTKKGLEEKALMRAVTNQFEEYIKLNPKIPPELISIAVDIENPGRLADIIASNLTAKIQEKQRLLEIINPKDRLKEITVILNSEIEILRLERQINVDVRKRIEKSQREYYLQEQLKAIEEELSEGEGKLSEVEELRKKIKSSGMHKEAEETALRELNKLSKMMSTSPEATVVRNYVDWLISLPWAQKTDDNLDIDNARRVLEEDHYGLEKPKERILEYLAVKKLREVKCKEEAGTAPMPRMGQPRQSETGGRGQPRQSETGGRGQILCFVGPPGVGKTSLAKSVGRALGRNFVRVSLGGIRDEAEIRGHRRTYIGALPGRIIQSIKKAKSKNPVFLLDEVDKMSMDFRGDPSSALLEVLDPEQNHAFSDHYLEVDFDLSDCLFITTANLKENIPVPLLDRMEIIKLPGYTDYEKLKIAKSFLISKQLAANGLGKENLLISDSAVSTIIRRYTREAGVRELERSLAKICRQIAKKVVKLGRDIKNKVTVNNLHKYLGPPIYTTTFAQAENEVGVATGLAWTETGGDIMSIETALMDGKGKLILTGKLGEVMQESAKASLSYIRAKAEELGIKNGFYYKKDFHIHVPEGAIPKDGPSAGITMATAMVSSLIGKPVRKDVAMTGEITLRGKVLPVGGLKSKILAAHRSGIKTIVIPKENEKDLMDIPKDVLNQLNIVMAKEMGEVLKTALA